MRMSRWIRMKNLKCKLFYMRYFVHCMAFNPFAPGDFAEKRVLKLVEWFSGHCRALKS